MINFNEICCVLVHIHECMLQTNHILDQSGHHHGIIVTVRSFYDLYLLCLKCLDINHINVI